MPRSARPFSVRLTCVLFLAVSPTISCSFIGRDESAPIAERLKAVRTLAGFEREFGEPFGIAVKGAEIYVSDGERGRIMKLTPDDAVSVFVEGLNTPSAIAFAEDGDLVVADTGSHTIKRIDESGVATIIAGVVGRSGFSDGEAASSLFNGPVGVAVDARGRIYVADTYNDRIRVIEKGTVRTLAGGERGFADGAAANFDTPLGVAIWHGDKLLVTDSGNVRVRVVEADGNTWTLAGTGAKVIEDGFPMAASFAFPTSVAVGPAGSIFVADLNAIRVIGSRTFPFVETLTDRRRGFADGRRGGSRFNRPSGLALDEDGNLVVADSDNRVVRVFSGGDAGLEIDQHSKESLQTAAEEFRAMQPARWPYDPPAAKREIAGTLGEVRGEVTYNENNSCWFHNGLDIAGGYGETARFIRSETVLHPRSAENFGTSRELIRLPDLGYIHIRLGRDQNDNAAADPRYQFQRNAEGKLVDVRVPRGARFEAGEPIGTLNTLNHVHLIAGRAGAEMNALDALVLPGASDSIIPTIERVSFRTVDWREIETRGTAGRIKLTGKTRLVVRAYDRMDGNAERRRLGPYRLGYQVFTEDGQPASEMNWTVKFDRMPSNDAVRFAYAPGSKSGTTGETILDYIVSNRVFADDHRENFLDPASFNNGTYTLRVFAADFFGNTASKDIIFEVSK